MAKHWPLLVTLLLAASAGAQELPESSSIVFRVDSPSNEPRSTLVGNAVRPAPPGASTRSPPNDDADIARRLAAVDAEESRTNERSPTLIDPLQSLATAYQNAGNQAAAIATLEKAVWILRVNSGLFSLDQVDVVETLLAARRASGQHTEAATLEDYLQQLATRNPEDARVARVIERLADAEMASAWDLIDTAPPPQFSLTMADGIPRPAVLRGPSLKALLAARRHYADAMLAGLKNGTENLAEYVALEDRLIGTLYFELAHPKLRYYEEGPSRFTRFEALGGMGVRMLQSKIDDTVRLQQSPIATAKAMIELGDWQLIFAANGVALAQYESARQVLTSTGVAQTTIDELLSPEIPAILPVPLVAAGRAPRGYIDAVVETGPYGNARSIDIVAASPETPKIIEKRLRQYLERSRVRPRFVDSQLARSDRFTARFYYDY